MARRLAHKGYTIISGAGPGIMEASNRGAIQGGARSIGLSIDLPKMKEAVNDYLTEHIAHKYFFTRKLGFMTLSDGFVAMPGGFGTLDEIFEILGLQAIALYLDVPLILFRARAL